MANSTKFNNSITCHAEDLSHQNCSGRFFYPLQKDLHELSNPLTFFCRRIILTLIPIFNTDVWGEKNAEKVSHATPLLHYKSLLRSMYLLCCCCSLGNEAVHTEMENFEEKIHKFLQFYVCTRSRAKQPKHSKKISATWSPKCPQSFSACNDFLLLGWRKPIVFQLGWLQWQQFCQRQPRAIFFT